MTAKWNVVFVKAQIILQLSGMIGILTDIIQRLWLYNVDSKASLSMER